MEIFDDYCTIYYTYKRNLLYFIIERGYWISSDNGMFHLPLRISFCCPCASRSRHICASSHSSKDSEPRKHRMLAGLLQCRSTAIQKKQVLRNNKVNAIKIRIDLILVNSFYSTNLQLI